MKKICLSLLVLLLALPLCASADTQEESTYPLKSDHLPMVSENYILLDRKTGVVVTGNNIDKQVHPASITKAITIITALEMLDGTDLQEKMTIVPDIFPIDSTASIAQFNPDDVFTYDDVLYGVALPSGADAADALSFNLTQSSNGLADDMNKLASRIGMKNTNFSNVTGLDADDHLTTVYDLAIGIDYALNNDDFRRYYTAKTHTSASSRMHPNGIDWKDSTLERADEMKFTQIIGAKSGYTDLAERSVSLLIESQGNEYIYVSTNASKITSIYTPILDAMKLVNEIELNFTRTELFLKDTPIKTHKVFGLKDALNLQFDYTQLEYLKPAQLAQELEYVYEGLPKYAFKTIKEGTEIGNLSIMAGEEVIFTARLIATQDYGLSIFMMIGLGLVAIVVIGLLLMLLAMAYFAIVRKRNRARRHRTLGC